MPVHGSGLVNLLQAAYLRRIHASVQAVNNAG